MPSRHRKNSFLQEPDGPPVEVFSSEELAKKLGHRTAILRQVQADALIPIGAGFYSKPGLDPFIAQVHVVAKYYPQAVISGVTALILHRLSDERTEKVMVDIPKSTRLRNKILETRRVAESRLIGIEKMDFHGRKIRIYDVERSLCDAYRMDRTALFFKALKRYLKEYNPQPERIAIYDQTLGTRVLRSLQQEFASG